MVFNLQNAPRVLILLTRSFGQIRHSNDKGGDMGNRCPLAVVSALLPGFNQSALLIALLICLRCIVSGQDSCSAKCTSSESPCFGLTGSAYGQCVTHCKQVCGQPPSPSASPDPRCSNRNAQGKITCTILKPKVNQHETAFPEVQFAPGDIVDVWADGCVQTGGWGKTWKRYVNPSGQGRNQQTLYHGLIRLPGGALVTVQSILGRHSPLPSAGVPLSEFLLHLGYQDDDYSDNSYDDHDDGTDDQCKTFGFNYGGPAYVTVTIYRGVKPDAPVASRYDFDLESNTADPNGFPYNPQWSWQLRHGNEGKIPSTSSCHEFSERPTTAGIPSRHMAPSFSDCTDQTDSNNVDMPVGGNSDLCDVHKTWETAGTVTVGSFVGHVNWFPVTFEGDAGWGDHQGFPLGDDDYSFTFRSEAGAPVPPDVNDSSDFHLHVEFDSDETIDHFTSDAWSAFRDAVDHSTKQQAAELFNGHTILTGMFGLDAEHNLKAELHPLYAIATRIEHGDKPEDEVWLIFVRNRGDEGFCSSHLWDAGFEDYTFHLPWRQGMTSVDVDSVKTQFEGTDGTKQPVYRVLSPEELPADRTSDAGVYATFHLGSPAISPFIDGALHLIWTGQKAPLTSVGGSTDRARQPQGDHAGLLIAATAMDRRTSAEGHDEVENLIAAAIKRLPPEQQAEVKRAKAAAGMRPVSVHRLPPSGPVQRITTLPAAVRIPRLHAIKAGPATEKAAREAAMIRALCAATHNAPAGLPAETCRGTVRDHR
jgi:hypothetical protein